MFVGDVCGGESVCGYETCMRIHMIVAPRYTVER